MTTERPNPDDLLERVRAEETRSRRGRLTIFFGYAAGVGKTYAMLEAARNARADGVDVVAGYVEPHGRRETEILLEGIETIPFKMVPYRGVSLREFDLDAALARKPRLILVDELAHTNAEGLRHAKRWQDIEELLDSGIDVYTTLNVQHVESLNDVVGRITGIVVRETVPDEVVERADEVELVDLSPEELMERLREGKVYVAPQAARALQGFFQKTNLVALRELSLRQAANRLRRQVDEAHRHTDARVPWATNERLLVCVSPSLTSAKLIRAAKRMADAFGGEWLAVSVEAAGRALSPDDRQRLADHFRLAEQLGGETHILNGEQVARAIVEYAQTRNVTKIIVGKTAQPWWRRVVFGAFVDNLLELSGDIDVYVIRGEGDLERPARPAAARPPVAWLPYALTLAIVAGCTLISESMRRMALAEANIAMVFLLGVVVAATRLGRGPAILASVLGVVVFDFFFVPPRITFAVADAQYILTFAIMAGIGILISTLTARIRDQLRSSQEQERRTAALYRLTRQLGELSGSQFLLTAASRWLTEVFGGENVLYRMTADNRPELQVGEKAQIAHTPVNDIVAQWVAGHRAAAGLGTETLPNATALFLPLTGSQHVVGVLGIRPDPPTRFADPGERRMLESCANLVALSLERDFSVLEAQDAQLKIQSEQLRSSLLSSVSHDLRTPLTVIAGSASRLLERNQNLADDSESRESLETLVAESHRLTRLVENLLEMTRLESGPIQLDRQWHVLEEIVGSARNRLRDDLASYNVNVHIPSDFPLLEIDGLLIEQVFLNLLENAVRYAPKGSTIEITATASERDVVIRVADDGPGLTPGSEAAIFDKFTRGTREAPDGRRGVGLGLAICKAIVQVHGGQITAGQRPGGGALFTLRLPRTPPPSLAPKANATTDVSFDDMPRALR